MSKNIFMCFIIYLMSNYSCMNKPPKSAFANDFTSGKKIIDSGFKNTTQCLVKKQKLVKLHNQNIKKTDSIVNIVSDIDSANNGNLLPISNDSPFPNEPEHTVHFNGCEKEQAIRIDAAGTKCEKTHKYGLLSYRKWWERTEVDLSVNGKLITGTPIFIEEDTLRVINNDYSYFIPLEKVDYIRSNDGLQSSFDLLKNKKN